MASEITENCGCFDQTIFVRCPMSKDSARISARTWHILESLGYFLQLIVWAFLNFALSLKTN